MEILEYLMKFNTVSLHWHNLGFSIIIIFLKIISLHLNHLKFQLKADFQSHAITLVHPDTIIQKKKKSVTLQWLNLMFPCHKYTPPPQLQMLNYYNNNTMKSMHYTNTTWNFQAIIFLLLRNKLHSL